MIENGNIFIDDLAWEQHWQQLRARIKQVCSRCVYNNLTPDIEFDGNGVCNYCKTHDQLMLQYPGGSEGQDGFRKIVDQIKHEGRKKPYDVIVGVSGGCDSSYLIHLAVEYGLRPLAVHFDNTWNSTIAVENIHNVLRKHNIDLWTHVVDNEEYDDFYKAILNAGTPDLEAPTDLALAATLNIAAQKYKVRYVFEGHSFKTEGLSPLGWLYMDARYIDGLHRRFGQKRRLATYPYLWLSRQLKWMLLNRLKKIRPLWYLDYDKNKAKALLTHDYNWRWYGGHHLENRMTAFYHTYFLPRRFGIDTRVNGFSGLVRSGQMSRDAALAELEAPPACDKELVAMILKRWRLSEKEWVHLMTLPKKYYTDYKTYKPVFERMRPFFYLMAKLELIPWSFYMKYTQKR